MTTKEETSSKKVKSSHKKKKEEKKEAEAKDIDIYFIILYPRKTQEKTDEFTFLENDINPQNIYSEEIKQENGTFYYKKVFKFNGKTDRKYQPEFEIGKDNYIISFEVQESSFIYDVELKKGNKRLKNIAKEIINQKSIEYYKKLDIFLESLKNNNEKDKIEILYRDTINLFKNKKGFSFLISLFIQICKDKKLGPLLMEIFKEMNNKPKDNEKNIDRNKDLEQYIKNFKEISSESDDLIKNNEYESQQFYGIILCYLNYYDQDTFKEIFKKLFIERCEDLYEILIIYSFHFLNPIEQNLDFFVKFIGYCASKKEFNIFKNALNYITDIETFITVIDKIKETIYDKYITSGNSFEPIKLKANLELKKRDKNKEIDAIINNIKSINQYSKDNKVLLVYFTSNFWQKILKDYNIPDQDNIKYCYELRELFFEYNVLINELYKKEEKSEIKKDINKYFEKDEFAFILDKNIERMLDNNADNTDNTESLSNSEMLGFVQAFNPYYKEDKYLYKRGTYIFDYIDLEDNTPQFIETFTKLEFETMFKDHIIDFLNKMVSKVYTISNFGTILELIDIKKITKVDKFFELLKGKYDIIIRKIDSLHDNELNNAVKIIAKFVDLKFKYDKNCKFIEENISKLDKRISSLIYNELMRRCKGSEYKMMKELIYQKFLDKLENVSNIIELIDSLEKQDKDDKKIFMDELMKKCQFTKEEYYSNKENKKIILLCELKDQGKLEINNDMEIYNTIFQIKSDLLDGEIPINKLKEFLIECDEKQVIKRLNLISVIYEGFEPEKQFKNLKKEIEELQKDIKELELIKRSLLIFFRIWFQNEIKDISNIIKDMQETNLKNYKSEKTQEKIKKLKELGNEYVKDVENVKDFSLFEVIYDETYGADQEKRFKKALKKLESIKESIETNTNVSQIYEENKAIFNKIKETLSNNEKANKFIDQMKKYFKIEEKKEEKKELIETNVNKLAKIFKSKVYEIDLKSIIYFFENFKIDNNNDKWKEKISSKYNLSEMELEELEKKLTELRETKIYDYENTNKNYNLFTSLYEKKEAIDFLLSKKNEEIRALYEKIDPTNRTITIKNIKDTEECIKIFNKLKEINDYEKIFEYIKNTLSEE